MQNKWIYTIAGVLVFSSFFLGKWMPSDISSENAPVSSSEKKPLYYRNAMNPSVTSPVPAKDNMGMDYVPVYADADNSEKSVIGTVKIDSTVVQNIGVRTEIAKKMAFGRTIRSVGRIEFDEKRMIRLHPKVEGWIDEIYIDKTGQKVKEDEILLSLYSPILVTTQQEYLLALNSLKTLQKSPFGDVRRGAESLVESSKERLELLDVPAHQISELEKTGKPKKNLHIHSPFAGTVVRIGSRDGQYVTPKTELYMIVDLSKVWVYADIYEYEIPWIKEGDEVEMTLTSVPGKVFKGKLVYIYPYAEKKSRATKVRIEFDNKEDLLRPNMFSNVVIKSQVIEDSIVIPAEAVVRSGTKEQVFVVREPGKFEPRMVKLGIESNGMVAVLSGIEAGEEIVTSSQFLVDSESSLREATEKMMRSSTEKNKDNEEKSKELKNDHSKMEHAPKNESSEMRSSETNKAQEKKMDMDMTDGASEDD